MELSRLKNASSRIKYDTVFGVFSYEYDYPLPFPPTFVQKQGSYPPPVSPLAKKAMISSAVAKKVCDALGVATNPYISYILKFYCFFMKIV